MKKIPKPTRKIVINPIISPLINVDDGLIMDGLVAWYDPGRQILEGTTGQQLLDYSGNGNHAQLGSTAGADTNDPSWNNGLSFGGDDYCVLTDNAMTKPDNFTIITVVKLNNTTFASRPCFGWSTSSDYVPAFYLNTATGKTKFMGNTTNTSVIEYPLQASDLIHRVISFGVKGKEIGSLTTAELWTNGLKQTPTNIIDTGTQLNKNTVRIGYGYSGTLMQAMQTQSMTLLYDRVLLPSEQIYTYNYLKKLMSQRGITI